MSLKDQFRPHYRTIDLDQSFKTAKEELEKAMILRHLNMNNNNLVKTSKTLGIARPTLYQKIDMYRIKF